MKDLITRVFVSSQDSVLGQLMMRLRESDSTEAIIATLLLRCRPLYEKIPELVGQLMTLFNTKNYRVLLSFLQNSGVHPSISEGWDIKLTCLDFLTDINKTNLV